MQVDGDFPLGQANGEFFPSSTDSRRASGQLMAKYWYVKSCLNCVCFSRLDACMHTPSLEYQYIYEGCPSKSWTFVITRDNVSGIL